MLIDLTSDLPVWGKIGKTFSIVNLCDRDLSIATDFSINALLLHYFKRSESSAYRLWTSVSGLCSAL